MKYLRHCCDRSTRRTALTSNSNATPDLRLRHAIRRRNKSMKLYIRNFRRANAPIRPRQTAPFFCLRRFAQLEPIDDMTPFCPPQDAYPAFANCRDEISSF